MRQAPLPKHPKRPAAPPARSRHALPAPATQVERFKPAHARPPAKHSSAPAHWTPEQKRRALALLRAYESGPKPGSAVRALDRLGHAYEHNPVARNPIVGRKGLLGGVEDLVKTADPIALGETLKRRAQHPLRIDKGLNAGIVVGGAGGFRVPEDVAGLSKEAAPRKTPAKPPIPNASRKPGAPPASEVVAKSLGSARRLAAEQKKIYREERAARIGKAQAASQEAGGGVAGHYAALREQKGEMPKTTFARLREGNLDQADIEKLVRKIDEHPELQFYGKQSARQALLDAFEHGTTPAPHQIKHLETVFGQDAATEIAHISKLKKAGQVGLGIANIPRSLMASFDLSAPFRQGLGGMVYDQKGFAKAFKPMVKGAASENYYEARLAKLHEDPEFGRAAEHGVRFTELGPGMSSREEAFPSSYAEKLNVPIGRRADGKLRTVGPGHIVRGSGRGYTMFLDEQRLTLFKKVVAKARKAGVNTEDRKFLKSTARFVNTLTGRGGLGKKLEPAQPVLNTFLFSPRLMASRIDTFIQPFDPRLHPFLRREAQKQLLKLGAFGAGAAGVGLAAGGQVGHDPRSANFAKIRFGNTRIDPLGGYQQYARLAAELSPKQIGGGKIVSSTTGRTMTLGQGYRAMNREDIIKNFVVQKFAPTPSLIAAVARGHTATGQPLNVRNEVVQRLTPLAVQDAYSTYKDHGNVPAGAAAYAAAALGIGVQTYGPRDIAKEQAAKSDKAAKEQNVHIQHLVQKGVLPKRYVKELRHSLDLYNEREALNAQIEHAVPDDHPHTREVRKTLGLIALLEHGKVLSPARADHFRKLLHSKAPHATTTQLQDARDSLWQHTAGKPITWYHKKTGYSD